MKRILIALILVSILANVEAQRLDLDKAWFDFSYRRLPNKVLDKSYMSYSVNITKTVALEAYSNESANGLIQIEGRKKVGSEGYFDVNVSLSDLIIENSEVVERVEIRKDKDGKETGRSYYYHVDVRYSFDADAQVKDYKGKDLAYYKMARRDSKNVFATSETNTRANAADYYNNNQLEIKTRLVSEQITGALNSLNSSLNSDFGYKVINSREYFWKLGSEKHPEHKTFLDACAAGTAALAMITADEMPESVKEKAQPAIDYFITIDGKYKNIEEKAEKKMRYAAYFNLAQIYLLTEQFEKAKEYAQKVIDNDFDPKDGEKIITEINTLTEQLAKHQISTRHFIPDVENIQPRP